MAIVFLDIERSTEITIALGRYWPQFLQNLYQQMESFIQTYEQYGCRRHKLIGDAILAIFSPQFASRISSNLSLEQMTRYAFEFASEVKHGINRWLSISRQLGRPPRWIQLLDTVLRDNPQTTELLDEQDPLLRIIASIATGQIIPIQEPKRRERSWRRREIAGVAIHRANRLTKVHELLPYNDIFVTSQCYHQLLDQHRQALPNITDIRLKGFSQPERVHSGIMRLKLIP